MIDVRLKKIFDLAKEVEENNYKKEYENLLQIDNSIGSFRDYVKSEKEKFNNVEVDSKKVEDAYIEKEVIKKDSVLFSLYLIHYNHIEPIEFDNDYKPLPLKEKELFEYGAIITFDDENGSYNINSLFGGIKENKTQALKEYNDLKNDILNSSEEDLIKKVENYLLNQLK